MQASEQDVGSRVWPAQSSRELLAPVISSDTRADRLWLCATVSAPNPTSYPPTPHTHPIVSNPLGGAVVGWRCFKWLRWTRKLFPLSCPSQLLLFLPPPPLHCILFLWCPFPFFFYFSTPFTLSNPGHHLLPWEAMPRIWDGAVETGDYACTCSSGHRRVQACMPFVSIHIYSGSGGGDKFKWGQRTSRRLAASRKERAVIQEGAFLGLIVTMLKLELGYLFPHIQWSVRASIEWQKGSDKAPWVTVHTNVQRKDHCLQSP